MATNQNARISLGSIRGSVSDDRGGPLSGAMVSALGVTTAMAMTDARGRFALDALPPGEYIVRVHLAGFLSTRRDNIHVGPLPATLDRIQLHRVERVVGTSGRQRRRVASDPGGRPRCAAGRRATQTTAPTTIPTPSCAWRLRHIKRSVLKDSRRRRRRSPTPPPTQPLPEAPSSIFGRAFDNAANMAASFFTDPPFSGEVNLLTTSALASGQQLFSSDFLPRGVAYMSIGAPAAGGELGRARAR